MSQEYTSRTSASAILVALKDAKSTTKYTTADSVALTTVPEHNSARVLPGTHGIARSGVIYSTEFRSCVAVVAKLKGGGFAIYHAYQRQGLQEFIKNMRGKVDEIVVFRKSTGAKADEIQRIKAPIFAAELEAELGVTAKCVEVEDYSTVVCDVAESQIYIAKKLIDQGESAAVVFDSKATKNPRDLSMKDALGFAENVKHTQEKWPEKVTEIVFKKHERLFDKPGDNSAQIRELLASSGFTAKMAARQVMTNINDPKPELDQTTIVKLAVSMMRIHEGQFSKQLRKLSKNNVKILCASSPEFTQAYYQTDAAKSGVERLVKSDPGKAALRSRAQGKPFVDVLIERNLIEYLPKKDVQKLVDDYPDAALSVAESKKFKQLIKPAMMMRSPAVAQKLLADHSVKIVEKMPSEALTAIASKDPKNAKAVFERFKDSGVRDAKSKPSRFSLRSVWPSSSNKPKFTQEEWLNVFINAGPEATSMMNSDIYKGFEPEQISLLKSQNTYVAEAIDRPTSAPSAATTPASTGVKADAAATHESSTSHRAVEKSDPVATQAAPSLTQTASGAPVTQEGVETPSSFKM